VIAALFFGATRQMDAGPAPAALPSLQTATLLIDSPTPPPSPTSPPPATPTLIAVALSPSATMDAVQAAIEAGGILFAGPLSNAQQVRLYQSSLAYVEPTARGSIEESKQINGVGYGDPSNICGPLAIAILRDAGLIPAGTVPHDYWLLNPDVSEDKMKLNHIFPPTEYSRSRVLSPINKIDWQKDPLLPGDFLFIWHGSGGNFDHMLVVSRVDKAQRAYAVTNFGTSGGYIIAETLLYDPADPNQGIFHTWTAQRDAILGSTGFGGFDLWRWRGN
jgi:hypothetical protein